VIRDTSIAASLSVEQLEGDPHPPLARLRSSAPVAWVPALGGWLVTGRDLALEVMRSPDRFTVDDPRFSTGRVTGRSMLGSEGEEHARHRAPFGPQFRRDAVHERLGPVVSDEVDRLVDAFAADGRRAELRGSLAGPLAAAVVMHALGLSGAGVDAVLGWYRAMARAVTEVTAGRSLPAAGLEAFEELRSAVDAAVEPPPGLSREESVSNAAVMLFGGIETTDGMIANAVMHLLSEPRALAAVRAEPSSVAAAVEESLRLEPAAATIDRYATRDTTLGGASIGRGDLVTVSIAAANRDPAAFEEPDRFWPGRPNAGRHLAFAAGPHVCIGMHLARLETHTALRRLLDRLPGLRLDPAAPRPAARGLVFRKPPELWVVW
jgi:cytochrome P450